MRMIPEVRRVKIEAFLTLHRDDNADALPYASLHAFPGGFKVRNVLQRM